jgi:hypothetical protein
VNGWRAIRTQVPPRTSAWQMAFSRHFVMLMFLDLRCFDRASHQKC